MKRDKARASRPVFYSLAAGALILAQAWFVAAYASHERTVYFWDHAMYIGMAQQAFTVFSEDFGSGWAMFSHSLAENYNLIFALPSFVSFSLFGTSRLVFVLTNFFVFFLGYETAVAFFLRRALGFSWPTALIISLVASSLIPPLWLPLLEGYPDSGAAACLVAAAALGWKGAIRDGLVRRAVSIGVFLGGAVLLRRHFIYASIALLAALACIESWEIWRARDNRGQKIKRAGIHFLLCGAGLIATLAAIAPDFLLAALTTDYGKLYFSYHRPALVFLRFVLGGFGIGLLLLAADGLFLLARVNKAGRRLAAFAVLFAFLWLVIWCLGPDQMGHHYILHALPLCVAAGLAGWFVHLARQPKRTKQLLGGLLVLTLAANSAWALWLAPTGLWPNDNGTPGLLAAPHPPVVRVDYDELHRLAAYLQSTTSPQDRIMMVGSSFVLNLDILHQIYRDMPEAAGMMARFPKNPEIDHEEPPPFDVFASSNIYLVPEPPQYHLDPAGQRVITAAANQFPPPHARADMFHIDEVAFHLADGVVVKIWRRDAWTPAALHDALADIRRDGPQDENFSQGWAAMMLPLHVQIFTNAGRITFAAALFDAAHPDMRLFFDYPLEKGGQRLAFTAASDCPAPRFHLAILDPEGRAEALKSVSLGPQEMSAVFSVSAAQDGRFLQLDVSTASAAVCRMELRNLRVERVL